jgi:hypothetical protein
MNRRVFVRVFSKSKINIDIESIFSRFGKIETAYLVNSSQTFEDGKYTMIGYVLFFDQANALKLIKKRSFNDRGLEFVLKRVKQKELTKKSKARKRSDQSQISGGKAAKKSLKVAKNSQQKLDSNPKDDARKVSNIKNLRKQV